MSLLPKKFFNHFDHNFLMTSNPVKIGIYQKNDALISDLNIEIIEKNNFIINTMNYYDKFDRFEMISIINRGLSYNERKKLWSLFANIDILKNQRFKDFNFKVECKRKGPADIHISKDLNRTMPSHEYFSFNKNEDEDGKQRLNRILTAYANFDKELGYSQGMNVICASLLIILNPKNDKNLDDYEIIDHDYEENVFWILVHIMIIKKWRDVLKYETPRFFELGLKFDLLLRKNLPKIYIHFLELSIDIKMVFDTLLLSILLYNTPISLCKKILDFFLFDDDEILLEILINFLEIQEKEIFEKLEWEDLYIYLKSDFINDIYKKYKNQKTELKQNNKTNQKYKLELLRKDTLVRIAKKPKMI